MAALRWFLFSLLCFGGGAAGAFALNPPQLGIPDAAAADLRSRLAKIEQYASEGRCDAVKGQLAGAESTVSKLPESTAVTTEQELRNAIDTVRTEAVSECLRVAASKETQSAEAQATTPTPTAGPTATAAPELTPTPAPDPGPGDVTPAPEPTDPGTGGGVSIPQGDAGAALKQSLREARKRYKKAEKEVQRTLDELNRGLGG